MKFPFLIFTIALVGLSAPVCANTCDAYESGQYRTAITLGEADGSAGAWVLVARARLALVDLGRSDNRKADIKAAIRAAKKSVALDPQNAETQLVTVAALGYRTRRMGRIKNFRKGMAKKSRRYLDAALALKPNSALAHAMLGIWHLEIIRRGGRLGARVTGARAEDGAQACAFALASKDMDAAIGTQCGIALLAVDRPELENAAFAAFRAVIALETVQSAYDAAMQERAAEILATFERLGVKVARERALYYLNFAAS